MTRPTPRSRGEELLLARISAAAGREHIGRRRATYVGTAHTPHAYAVPVRWLRGLLAFARYGRPSATRTGADARLDLYEHGLTIAVNGRIHVVRYDTTSVLQKSTQHPHDSAARVLRTTRTYALTDVEGERVVLLGRPQDSGAEEWGPAIQRAVTHAQLPRALAALERGERLAFGDVWLTREQVGSGTVSARWPQVRQIDITTGAIRLNTDGNWHTLMPTTSTTPNLFLFCALVERLRTDGMRP
ncbi:hypothetical protein DY245_05330 [Streptomyces inhibens]|uniref:Uncharacterized protein n=1 Tax=Streptomyces inhibens TaxID=2293571 RepID=A0A371Q9F5_STRIH|nr:DUF6585 family protein [Streptomyces inhibens]REK91278.1 hypothetical protein DY245_05330 [Streptomyces inhibens]